MRTLLLFSLILLLSCGERINTDRYHELVQYNISLERIARSLEDDAHSEYKHLQEKYGRHTSQPHIVKIMTEVENILHESVEIVIFIKSWKDLVIEDSGGYPDGSDDIYSFNQRYINWDKINWHKTITPSSFLPADQDLDEYRDLVRGDKSVLLSLIELSNLEIKFTSEALKAIREISEPVVDANIIREVFLIKELPLRWGKVLPGPRLWKIEYYPIDTLGINGISYWGEGGYTFSPEEWKSIQPITDLNVSVSTDYGDSTIHFISRKR